MADAMFTIMWSHIRELSLIYEGNRDLICVMCSHLLADACVGACGCKYCYKCISVYNIAGDKHCPGNNEYCKDNHLLIGRDIFRNEIFNKRVSKVKVNCPNPSCECNFELIQLDDHLRVCNKQPMECPYIAIGCASEKGNKDSIITHLHTDTLGHTGLLLELIENMKNEVSGLKESLEKSKFEETEKRNKEMEDLKHDIEETRIERVNLVEMVDDLRRDFVTNSENNKLEIATLKEELTKKDNKIFALERKLKGDIAKNETKVERRLTEEVSKIEKVMDEARIERDNLVTMVEDLRREREANFEKVKLKMETLNQDSSKKDDKIFELERKWKEDIPKKVIKLIETIKTIEIRLAEESSKGRSDVEEQRRQNDNARNEMDKIVDDVRNQLREMTDEMEIKVKKEREEIKKYIDGQSRQSEDIRVEREKVVINEIRKNIDERIKSTRNCLDRAMFRWTKLCSNINVDFVWRIDQCSTKIGECKYSESFYSNNYKLCLRVCIRRDDNITLCCYIMKGDNDDNKQWPMKRSVTLAIIDQCTLRTHKTETYNYDTYEEKSAFDRPTSDMNTLGIGSSSFIKYSNIKDETSIIFNDSMIVSCVLTDS